jgi:hypothetical protein
MQKGPTLAEQRIELIRQMEGYRSLPEYILDGLGSAFQRLVNPRAARSRPGFLPPDASDQEYEAFPSYWLNGFAIALFTLLVGWVISLVSSDPLSTEELKLLSWAAATGGLALIANKVNIRAFLDTFRNSCVDKMLKTEDIVDLGDWLHDNFKWWKSLFAGLLIGPLLGWLLYISWLSNHQGAIFHVGPFVAIVLACIQAVWVGYYLYPFYVAFPSRLHRYHFDLYEADPSSSEVVGRLSRLLTFIMYVTMGYIVWLTIGLTFVDVLTAATPLPGIVFSVFVWAPTVILYAAGQFHLSEIITHAKWKMLNEVQAKVEELYKERKIPDEGLLDRLGKLMDYHDRIRDTPNSALNFRAGLNFLNSLLLPVFAFLLANLKEVISLFK